MENRFIITAESGCDLSKELCERLGIKIILNRYVIDGITYYDDMTERECKIFFERMRKGAVPSSSQINPSEYKEFWEELAEEKLPIVHVALSAGISGSYNNAVNAARLIKEEHPQTDVTVIDSATASSGYGMIVLKAAELRDKGFSAEECCRQIEAEKHNYNAWYTTGELKYLYRGGRISKASTVVGSVLCINPILNVDYEGHLQVFDKARGEKATLKRFASIIKERAKDAENSTLYISHSDCIEKAHKFAEAILSEVKFKNTEYFYIGPTIGTHTGPGLVSIFFYGEERI